MTDHLPECPMLDERYPKHPLEKCPYCEMLRACEQRVWDVLRACEERVWDVTRACEERVRLEDHDYAYVAAQAEADGRRRGWADALDAARDAIAALPTWIRAVKQGKIGLLDQIIDRDAALSAIDALWEKP